MSCNYDYFEMICVFISLHRILCINEGHLILCHNELKREKIPLPNTCKEYELPMATDHRDYPDT